MTRFHCTVEFRVADGAIHQHVVDLDAPDADKAALNAEMELMKSGENSDAKDSITVEQVVCWQEDGP